MSRARSELASLIARVTPPRAADREAVAAHLDSLTKLLGSLGRVESIALQLAMIYGGPSATSRVG